MGKIILNSSDIKQIESAINEYTYLKSIRDDPFSEDNDSKTEENKTNKKEEKND